MPKPGGGTPQSEPPETPSPQDAPTEPPPPM